MCGKLWCPHNYISAKSINDAVLNSKVILIALSATIVAVLARQPGMGTCPDLVKGFFTTSYENMADPVYDGVGLDLFTAGDSRQWKKTVEQLAKDTGFSNCFDFGDDKKFELIEQFVKSWIKLAIMQGIGRKIALKQVRRSGDREFVSWLTPVPRGWIL